MQKEKPNWAGLTCVVMASGPSLMDEGCLVLPGPTVTIAVNSTWRVSPQANVVYAGDFMWWKVNHQDVRRAFSQERCWTQDSTAAERYGLNRIKGVNRPGLGLQHIHSNGNSGFQAINLAFLFGCRRILLLGFDMGLGPKGQKHWHPDHPGPLMQAQCFSEWIHKGAALANDLKANGCEVINCTPRSALKCFPMSTLQQEL